MSNAKKILGITLEHTLIEVAEEHHFLERDYNSTVKTRARIEGFLQTPVHFKHAWNDFAWVIVNAIAQDLDNVDGLTLTLRGDKCGDDSIELQIQADLDDTHMRILLLDDAIDVGACQDIPDLLEEMETTRDLAQASIDKMPTEFRLKKTVSP